MRNLIYTLFLCLLASCASLTPATTGKFTPSEPNGIAKKIWLPNGKADRFALIIAGDAELRHQGNVSVAYQTLLAIGHEPHNIIVLSEGNKNTPWFGWTDAPTLASVEMAMNKLAFAVEPEHDSLAVYVTGHGTTKAIEAYDGTYSLNMLKLNPAENLPRSDFNDMLKRIRPKFAVLVMDHCYWAVFEELSCAWSQYSATRNGVVSNDSTFGRTFWREFAKPGVSMNQSFERASAASPKDTPTVKVCRDDIPDSVPIPEILPPPRPKGSI